VVFGTNNLRIAQMVELFRRDLPRIAALAADPGPWVYRMAQHGFDRLVLNCDDA